MVTHNESDTDVTAIMGRIDKLSTKVVSLGVSVERVASTMVTRQEISAADDRRVLVETFQAHVSANDDRLKRLENGPQRMLGWIAVAVSGGLGCMSVVVAVISIVVTVWIASSNGLHP